MNKLTLVLGPHRSGTSLLNGCLSLLGYHVGDKLLPANKGNPKGYFEDTRVVKLNDTILQTFNLRWDDTRPFNKNWLLDADNIILLQLLRDLLKDITSNQQRVSLKDPRLCRVLPIWLKATELFDIKLELVVLIRPPSQSIYSLMKRDNTSFKQSALIWLRYCLELVQTLKNMPYRLIQFDHLVTNPVPTLEQSLNLNINPATAAEINDFFNPALLSATLVPENIINSEDEYEIALMNKCDMAYRALIEEDLSCFSNMLAELDTSYMYYKREIDSAIERQFKPVDNIENLKKQVEIHSLKVELASLKKQLAD